MPQETQLERDIRWITNGIDSCINNGAFISVITLMLLTIDGLSGYYTGSLKDHYRSSQSEFINFVTKYFIQFNANSKDANGNYLLKKMKRYREPQQSLDTLNYYEILYTQYRCGLAHNLLMKAPNAIYRGRNNPYFYSTRGFKIVINVELFYDDFVNALKNYKNDVITNTNRLKYNYRKRFKFMTGKYPAGV
jgi:hypothetical protein